MEWIGRPSPSSSPYQSDEEDYDADAVEGLLGIADTDRLEEVEVGGGVDEDNN